MSTRSIVPTTRRALPRTALPSLALLRHNARISMPTIDHLPLDVQRHIYDLSHPFEALADDADAGYALHGSEGVYDYEDGKLVLQGTWTLIGQTSLLDWTSAPHLEEVLDEAFERLEQKQDTLGNVMRPLARFLESLEYSPKDRLIIHTFHFNQDTWHPFDSQHDSTNGFEGLYVLKVLNARMRGASDDTLFAVHTALDGQDAVYTALPSMTSSDQQVLRAERVPTMRGDEPAPTPVPLRHVLGTPPVNGRTTIGSVEYELDRMHTTPDGVSFVVARVQPQTHSRARESTLDCVKYTLGLAYDSSHVRSNAFARAVLALSNHPYNTLKLTPDPMDLYNAVVRRPTAP
jgi:hypothetical protein